MKSIFCLIFAVHSVFLYAQQMEVLDANNAEVMLSDDGIFFNNPSNSSAGYEIPAGDDNHAMYTMTFWTSAIESDSTVHLGCNFYPGTYDLYPGPVSDNYFSSYYATNFGSAIWKITRDQVNYHVSNFTAVGYVPDPAIANWPGNGNLAEGVAAQLAPYVDVDGDQVYNPINGDFPYFQGQQAVYVILNDDAGTHNNTGGVAMGIEIHAMFYQFTSADPDKNNTTFLNTTIYNRRDTSYSNFIFGLSLDPDLGFATDDLIGSDSARSIAYVYNGVNSDPGGSGQPGYGPNPPAFGAKFLNAEAGCVMTPNLGPSPTTPLSYYTWMQGADMNDVPLLPNSTRFAYNGNPFTGIGWSEVSEGNPPGDRRTYLGAKGAPLASGSSLCYDIAFVFARENVTMYENVEKLMICADNIQNYYDSGMQPCSQIFLETGIYENNNAMIYPNPTTGIITIQGEVGSTLTVFDLSGRCAAPIQQIGESGIATIEIAESGIYLVKIESASGSTVKRIKVLN
jgi:hypothetical protein